jgi:Rrf2 family transcriptional regulator, cysteine metabolism repressor
MFALTTKSNYGLLAILDLAEHYGRELVQVKDIVKRRRVPKNYLEQILNRLTKQRIVNSVRGNKGGYELAEHPDALTLLRVLESIEGAIKLSEASEIGAMKELFSELQDSIKASLNVSISQLVERQQSLEQQIVFQI